MSDETGDATSEPQIKWLNPTDPPDAFPDIHQALSEPDGLLAAGGDLSIERLLAAYSQGIFPWFDDGQPILWWSPNPRCVIRPSELHVSKRLRQSARQSSLSLSFNQAFGDVVRACAAKRESQQGTWITPDMMTAYEQLHGDGWAHSIEVWDAGQLVGGVYGLVIGKVFFGESMFSAATNASKYALLGLSQQMLNNDLRLLDCQVVSEHLLTLGACAISRADFAGILRQECHPLTRFELWPKESLQIRDLMPN